MSDGVIGVVEVNVEVMEGVGCKKRQRRRARYVGSGRHDHYACLPNSL